MTRFVTHSTLLSLLILSSAGVASAQNLAKARGLIDRLDANNDKVLERSEVPAEALPAFEKLLAAADDNKDGKIDAREFRVVLQSAASQGAAPMRPAAAGKAGARLAAMDGNKDGKVTRDEFQGPQALFDRFDANKDGTIEQSEIPKPAEDATGSPAKPKEAAAAVPPMFRAMDADKDGKISKQEFTGPEALFARLDADSDGSLSQEEAVRFAEATLARLKSMDSDGDRRISSAEFKGRPAVFGRLDRNQDGFLSLDELGNLPAQPAADKAAKGKAADKIDPKPTKDKTPVPTTSSQP